MADRRRRSRGKLGTAGWSQCVRVRRTRYCALQLRGQHVELRSSVPSTAIHSGIGASAKPSDCVLVGPPSPLDGCSMQSPTNVVIVFVQGLWDGRRRDGRSAHWIQLSITGRPPGPSDSSKNDPFSSFHAPSIRLLASRDEDLPILRTVGGTHDTPIFHAFYNFCGPIVANRHFTLEP